MAGGLLQLICYGAQDIYLTNNPQITFFKIVYRRHTNFSIQTFEKTFNDNPDFGKSVSQKLYRLGDLATKMHLRIVINSVRTTKGIKFAWIRRLGHAMINRVEINIGGNVIDRQYGTWLDIWYELTRGGQHERGYSYMIGDVDIMTDYNDRNKPEFTLYIPLQFWFNRHFGLALPLIAILYHEIYVNVTFEENRKLIVRSKHFNNFDDVKILEMGLVTDYIYLDYEERKRFAITGHEYLIEQVQFSGEDCVEIQKKRLLLNFNFPTKELIWVMRNGNYITGLPFLCYTNKDNWANEIIFGSKKLLFESMILSKLETNPPPCGNWEEFRPGSINLFSSNGNLEVTNNSNNTLWINVASLTIGHHNITGTIEAIINVTINYHININIISGLCEEDISIPITDMNDTRIFSDDVYIYQFSNYGILINGKLNPLEFAMLEYNAQNRVDRRNGKFFGELQPYIHHSNTPKDGINLYSFAIEPENLQPSGTSNFSKIENVVLTMWFKDHLKYYEELQTNKLLSPQNFCYNSNFLNLYNRLFIFAFSYNVFKIISGLAGIIYTN